MDESRLLEKIREIVKKETMEIVQVETRKIVHDELLPVHRILEEHSSQLKKLDKKTTKIQKDLDFVVGEPDGQSNRLEKRVRRIESHLGLST